MASTGRGTGVTPFCSPATRCAATKSFLEKELKFARRLAVLKGDAAPEDRNPVDVQMEAFFDACRTGKRPLAPDLESQPGRPPPLSS